MAWGQEWDPQMWPLRGTFWGKRMGVGLGETGGLEHIRGHQPIALPQESDSARKNPMLANRYSECDKVHRLCQAWNGGAALINSVLCD